MNKKGFTLIELLAVIVILSSISLIVVASISSSLGRRDEKECQEQVALAKNAAKIYFSLSNKTDEKTVTIECLKGGIDDGKCKEVYLDVKKTDKLSDDMVIRQEKNTFVIYKSYVSNDDKKVFDCSES